MSRTNTTLAFIALTMVTVSVASGDQAKVPDWIKLRVGQAAYFGVGYVGPVPACPTLERYTTWLKSSPEQRALEPCPSSYGGQRVTVLAWKIQPLGVGLVAPVVHVRFAHGTGSAWTLLAAPAVPSGTIVTITGSDCSAEVARDHADASSLPQTLSACRAGVVKQVVSRSHNTLLVRFVRSGRTVSTATAGAFLPNGFFSNGHPRYSLESFIP